MKVTGIKKERGCWCVTVDTHKIKVTNTLCTAKLFVDDKLQDIYYGMIGCPILTGKLPNGKEIKIKLGGDLKIHCSIFVDCVIVLED